MSSYGDGAAQRASNDATRHGLLGSILLRASTGDYAGAAAEARKHAVLAGVQRHHQLAFQWLAAQIEDGQTAEDADGVEVVRLLGILPASEAREFIYDDDLMQIALQAASGTAIKNLPAAEPVVAHALMLIECVAEADSGRAERWARDHPVLFEARWCVERLGSRKVDLALLTDVDRTVSTLEELADLCETNRDADGQRRCLEQALQLHQRWFEADDDRSCGLVLELIDVLSAAGDHERVTQLVNDTVGQLDPEESVWPTMLLVRLALAREEARASVKSDESVRQLLDDLRSDFADNPDFLAFELARAATILRIRQRALSERLARLALDVVAHGPTPEDPYLRSSAQFAALLNLGKIAELNAELRADDWLAVCRLYEEAHSVVIERKLEARKVAYALTSIAFSYSMFLLLTHRTVRMTQGGRELLRQAGHALVEAERQAGSDPNVAFAVGMAALQLARATGRPWQAENPLRQALAAADATQPVNPHDVARARANLGASMLFTDRHREGLEHMRIAALYQIRRPDAAAAMKWLMRVAGIVPRPLYGFYAFIRGDTRDPIDLNTGAAGSGVAPLGQLPSARVSIEMPRGIESSVIGPLPCFIPGPIDAWGRTISPALVVTTAIIVWFSKLPGGIEARPISLGAIAILMFSSVIMWPRLLRELWKRRGVGTVLSPDGIWTAPTRRLDWRDVEEVCARRRWMSRRVLLRMRDGRACLLGWPRCYWWWPQSASFTDDVAVLKQWLERYMDATAPTCDEQANGPE